MIQEELLKVAGQRVQSETYLSSLPPTSNILYQAKDSLSQNMTPASLQSWT